MDGGRDYTFACSGMGLMSGGLCSQGKEGVFLSLEQGGIQTDPGGPWPLEEVLMPHPIGNPTGRGGRKLIMKISSLQMSVFPNPLITPEPLVQDLSSRDWIESQQFIIIFIFN